MSRELRPCGTEAAYKRHQRRGEPVDDVCAVAERARALDRITRRRALEREQLHEVVRLSIVEAPAVEAEIDPLSKARENLRMVEAVMGTGNPTGFAALSKQHVELVALIARLEKASRPGVSALDDIARRRADRLAASQD
jgi:hypothetical protein